MHSVLEVAPHYGNCKFDPKVVIEHDERAQPMSGWEMRSFYSSTAYIHGKLIRWGRLCTEQRNDFLSKDKPIFTFAAWKKIARFSNSRNRSFW